MILHEIYVYRVFVADMVFIGCFDTFGADICDIEHFIDRDLFQFNEGNDVLD